MTSFVTITKIRWIKLHLHMAYGTFQGLIFVVESGYEVRISMYILCNVLYSDFCEIIV